jgi:aspartate carbamoyltransferase catalytic subunit
MFGLNPIALQEKTKAIQEHCINMEVSHEHESGVCVIVTANKIKHLVYDAEKHSPEQVKDAINQCFEKWSTETREYFETNIDTILESVPRVFRQELKNQLLGS